MKSSGNTWSEIVLNLKGKSHRKSYLWEILHSKWNRKILQNLLLAFCHMIYELYLCAYAGIFLINKKLPNFLPFVCFFFFFSCFLASFTVMCYNVLCDKYATRQLYGYCPSWALNWEYRKKGIMEEIVNWDADIISLQVTL